MTYQIELHIDGMHCGMCEAHVNNTLRNTFDLKKVSSSAARGTTTLQSAFPISEEDFMDVLNPTGYRVIGYSIQEASHTRRKPAQKKGHLPLIKTGPAFSLHFGRTKSKKSR